MGAQSIILLAVFLLALLALAYPLGKLLAIVAHADAMPGPKCLRTIENRFYRLCGVNAASGMGWQRYAASLIAFNAVGTLFVYAVQRLQQRLPLNPQHMGNLSPDSAFNTAVSFASNTNWQGYAGESAMSYLTQMLALTPQNFFSAATGVAVVFALIRGLVTRSTASIGNFWVDLCRTTLYVLLPLSIIFSVFLMGQGVIQNFSAYPSVQLLEQPLAYDAPDVAADGTPVMDAKGNPVTHPASTREQIIAMGPVASQEAIKMIGTNGGGFFNANSAHPFENPTPLSNFVQMLSMSLIPAALCFAFGHMVNDRRQGWTILGAMTLVFVIAVMAVIMAEHQAHPALAKMGIDQSQTVFQSGGNMEGKETRFGIDASALFAAITTAASCGAVNAMHDSFMPLGGMTPLVLIQLGEVIFGGVGSGLYGMLIFAILTVFIAGLMIGRTPEYLGKKIQAYEMKMVSLTILVTPVLVLTGTAIAVMTAGGMAGVANPGAHGFSEKLYALSSAANNNGSAFAGLSANTPFYNTLLGIVMWLGRFAMMVPILALAGSLAARKKIEATPGTMPTHGVLFLLLLISTVVLVGVLNYVPALALGPVVEHLQLLSR